MLTACAAPVVAARPEPAHADGVGHALCRLGFTEIAMRTLATGHHQVEARLNGRPAIFIVDTGANVTVVDSAVAAEFGVGPSRPFPGRALGMGGATTAQLAPIRTLQIGPVQIRLSRVATSDLGQVLNVLRPVAGKPIHGIIGQDVLSEHRAVVDVARAALYLIAADRDPAPVPRERCAAHASS
jgi:hypothetical protein